MEIDPDSSIKGDMPGSPITLIGAPAGDLLASRAVAAATPAQPAAQESKMVIGQPLEGKKTTFSLKGVLEKLKSDPSIFSLSQWNMRFWCVHPDKAARRLSYWNSEDDYVTNAPPKKSIDLLDMKSVAPVEQDKASRTFTVHTSTRIFTFRAKSTEDRDRWAQKLAELVQGEPVRRKKAEARLAKESQSEAKDKLKLASKARKRAGKKTKKQLDSGLQPPTARTSATASTSTPSSVTATLDISQLDGIAAEAGAGAGARGKPHPGDSKWQQHGDLLDVKIGASSSQLPSNDSKSGAGTSGDLLLPLASSSDVRVARQMPLANHAVEKKAGHNDSGAGIRSGLS